MPDDAPPEPLVPADYDVSMLDSFMLNVRRLLASELMAIGTPEECWAAFLLWCRAWQQVPGGSLPNDDRKLAAFSGAGSRWKRVKAVALHGFVLCSDGRLYHRFLCEEVKRAYKSHMDYETRREADRKRLSDWRAKRFPNADETADETRFVALETRQDKTRQELASKQDSDSLPREWGERAAAARSEARLAEADLPAEWAKFRAKIDGEPTEARWLAWALKARAKPLRNGSPDAASLPDVPWPQRCRSWAKGRRWQPDWGPPPDEPGCWAPQEIVAEALQLRNGRAH